MPFRSFFIGIALFSTLLFFSLLLVSFVFGAGLKRYGKKRFRRKCYFECFQGNLPIDVFALPASYEACFIDEVP